MFWKHSWHYCCWALIVAMLPREKACSATGIAWDAWIWPPLCRKLGFHDKNMWKTAIFMHIQVWAWCKIRCAGKAQIWALKGCFGRPRSPYLDNKQPPKGGFLQEKAPKAKLLALIQCSRKKKKDASHITKKKIQNTIKSARLENSKLVRCA